MRVLFVSNYPHLPDIYGGLQTTTHDLCLAIQTMGAQAAVLCGRLPTEASRPPSIEDTLGYTVIRSETPEHDLGAVAAQWNADCIVVQTGMSLLPMVVRSLATAADYHAIAQQQGAHYVAATPLVVGRFLTELALHRHAQPQRH